MKLSAALAAAWRAYCRHFGDLMKTLLVTLAVGGMALCPLLFLSAPETQPLAWLSAVLFVLLVLPLRQNTAEALQDMLSGGRACSPRLISLRGYPVKVLRGLRTLLWTLPLIAGVVLAYQAATGDMDVFTLMGHISNLGSGDLFNGIIVLAVIYAATLIPIVFGLAFHSGSRHAAALGNPRLVRGHRIRLMLMWLLSLLPALIPVAVIALIAVDYASSLVSGFMQTFSLTLTAPPAGLFIAAIVLAVMLVLLAPLRALLPAVYLRDAEAKHNAQA